MRKKLVQDLKDGKDFMTTMKELSSKGQPVITASIQNLRITLLQARPNLPTEPMAPQELKELPTEPNISLLSELRRDESVNENNIYKI